MMIGFTDNVTELRARAMRLASEVATRIYGFNVSLHGFSVGTARGKFDLFFDPVHEYMAAPGWEKGDTVLVREAALQSALTLYSAKGVVPPPVKDLLSLAKSMSHSIMPDLLQIEQEVEKRPASRSASPAMRA